MNINKPQATAAVLALLAWLLVGGPAFAGAQDDAGPPPEPGDTPPAPEMEYPEVDDEEPEAEAEPDAEPEAEPAEAEEATPDEGGAPTDPSGSAFGDVTYPPGTFPDPEPAKPPPPPEEPVDEGEGEQGEGESPIDETPDEVDEGSDIELDAIIPTNKTKKNRWQVQGLYELHFNVMSADYSANDWLAFWMLRGNFDITKFDQLSLRLDLEQRFIADPGESGLWFGDIRLYYSRKFTIPIPKFPIPGKASIYFTFPTSRQSIKRSYITKPTAVLTLAPGWGPLTLIANGYFRYSIAKYAESDMGSPNTLLTTGYMFQLIYAPLDWFAPSVAWSQTFGLDYANREGDRQRWQSNYYWEIALNFSLPMPEKAPSIDVSLAYAQGGNPLSEGIYRLYFAKRDQSEIYLGINMIY